MNTEPTGLEPVDPDCGDDVAPDLVAVDLGLAAGAQSEPAPEPQPQPGGDEPAHPQQADLAAVPVEPWPQEALQQPAAPWPFSPPLGPRPTKGALLARMLREPGQMNDAASGLARLRQRSRDRP